MKTQMRDVRDCPKCGAAKGKACRTPSCPQLQLAPKFRFKFMEGIWCCSHDSDNNYIYGIGKTIPQAYTSYQSRMNNFVTNKEGYEP